MNSDIIAVDDDNSTVLGSSELGYWTLPLDRLSTLDQSIATFRPKPSMELVLTARVPELVLTRRHALQVIDILKTHTDIITWDSVFLEASSDNPHYYFLLSQILDMFPRININQTKCSIKNVSLEMAFALNHAVEKGGNLKELLISGCDFDNSTMGIISTGLQSESCTLQRLCLDHIRVRHSNDVDRKRTTQALSEGFSNNKSLARIEISIDVAATIVSTILSSVVGQSNLKSLCLEHVNFTEFIEGSSLIAVTIQLLTNPHCGIVSLEIMECTFRHHDNEDEDDDRRVLSSLLDAIKHNHSLEKLDLSSNSLDEQEVLSILNCIRDCPDIREVDIDENVDEIDFGQSQLAHPHPPNKLQKLHCAEVLDNQFSVNEGAYSGILQLLLHNPLLGDLGLDLDEDEEIFPPNVLHLLDLNLSGRVLLSPRNDHDHFLTNTSSDDERFECKLPTSIWPIVLERSNKKFISYRRRQANAIYYFLREGPVLFCY
eukprot:scaffold1157_cov122-Cylindrotheca_fusiformis.AAC.20